MGYYHFWCNVYKLILEARESLWAHVESKKPLFAPALGWRNKGRKESCLPQF